MATQEVNSLITQNLEELKALLESCLVAATGREYLVEFYAELAASKNSP